MLVASPYWYVDDPDDMDEPPTPAYPDQSRKADIDGDGLNDVWPGPYDNYFVPRGYAVVLADSLGTGQSTGCPTTGGPEDVRASRLVVDWLNGRASAYTAQAGGSRVNATWATGKTGMVGLSYVGTLPNGVASTGVEGLETIVPQAAISDWYGYYRTGGLRFRLDAGPDWLANYVTPAARRFRCEPAFQAMADQAGEVGVDPAVAGNDSAFWQARNYVRDVRKVRASVFMVNGMNDLNVKPLHAGPWWDALAANDVPRKAWLTQMGHIDPFHSDFDLWMPTLHRWFDYWLADVDNGIMDEPMATIERQPVDGEPPAYDTRREWPDTSSAPSTLWTTDDGISTTRDPGAAPSSWNDDVEQSEQDAITGHDGPQHSVAYLTEPLQQDVRISGQSMLTARIRLTPVDGQPLVSASLGAMLVDYGPADYPAVKYDDGYGAEWDDDVENCMPDEDGSQYDSPCFSAMKRVYHRTDREIVTKGAVDIANRNSLSAKTPVPANTDQWVKVPLWTKDYTFPAGHRIGLVIVGSYPEFTTVPPDNGGLEYTLQTKDTSVTLPIVGGAQNAGL